MTTSTTLSKFRRSLEIVKIHKTKLDLRLCVTTESTLNFFNLFYWLKWSRSNLHTFWQLISFRYISQIGKNINCIIIICIISFRYISQEITIYMLLRGDLYKQLGFFVGTRATFELFFLSFFFKLFRKRLVNFLKSTTNMINKSVQI